MNIQGLLNNLTELKYVLRKLKADICMLNETHLTDDIDGNEVKVNGYNVIRCDSDSSHTGGVVVYINKSIKFRNVESFRTKFSWIVAFQMNLGGRNVTIAAVYLSASESKAEILKNVDSGCEEHCEGKSIVIAGDFNIDMTTSSTYSQRIVSLCADNGLDQLVNKPTRFTNVSSTTIDLCLTIVYGTTCVVSDEHCQWMKRWNY